MGGGSGGGSFGASSAAAASSSSRLFGFGMISRVFQTLGKTELTRELICRCTVSACVGVGLGIIASLIVNCTLVEISMSSFFSFYFGLLFITVGSVILWRISVTAAAAAASPSLPGVVLDDSEVLPQQQQLPRRKQQLQFFACLIILSGILCFVLKKNWFVNLHAFFKVPLYAVLGISVAFALTFSLVDMVNYLLGFFFQNTVAKPLVESREQVTLVLTVALLMGGVFGLIFGLMDVEDEVQYHVRLALLREQRLCYPIGALLGGFAGTGNELLRHAEETRLRMLAVTEFDEEI